MSVRIGINPLTWTNDDMPELGANTPLETCLAEGKEAGYSGFELGYKFPRDPNVLGPILENHDLSLVSGWYSSKLLERSAEEEINALQDHLKLLKALKANVMVFCEVTGCVHGQKMVPVSQRPKMTETQWKDFLSKIEVVGQYLQSEGVALAYHHHMGTVIETEEDIDRLMNNTSKSVSLLLDTGHLTYSGGNPINVAKRHTARIKHVHCKDIRPSVLQESLKENLSFLDAVLKGTFTVPGDGFIDYVGLFDVLKDANYSGWLVVEAEQDPEVANPLKYAKLGYLNLLSFCNNANIKVL